MKSVETLLEDLERRDIKLWVDGDRLRYNAPKGAMPPELVGRLREHKQALIDRLKKNRPRADAVPDAIRPAARTGPIPLSFGQERMWFLNQLTPENPSYNLTGAFHIKGRLDIGAMEQSFNEIIRRHEVLRTTFSMQDERPVQMIGHFPAVQLTPIILADGGDVDDGALPDPKRNPNLRHLIVREAETPFDLTEGPLLRLKLLKLSGDEYILLVAMHHIVSDGWSMGIFIREICVCYAAFSSGQPSPLAESPIQYADFAVWQRKNMTPEKLADQFAYWQKQLAGAPPALDLPLDHPRPSILTFKGAAVRFEIGNELTWQLHSLSRQAGTTLFMTLFAAFAVLLHRYSGQEDMVIGVPIANRNRKEIEPLIGFFLNTLALRADLSSDPDFMTLLKRVRQTALDAYANQDAPFERLVEAVQPERSLSRTPLFQVMFVLQNAHAEKPMGADIAINVLETETVAAQFDLTLEMVETGSGLACKFDYTCDLFEESTISRMAGHLGVLLEGVAAHPDLPISDLPLLTRSERRRLLHDFSGAAADYPRDKTIVQLFENQVLKTPDNVAVIFGNIRIRYQELNEKANRIAHFLRQEYNIQPEDRVGVVLHRSEWLIIGMMGIMKAGGAYVPVDPEYPLERIGYMLEDSGCKAVLTEKENAGLFLESKAGIPTVNIRDIDHPDKRNPSHVAHQNHLAYVIYTSGSTGQPKGVMLEHQGFINMVLSQINELGIAENDSVLQFASCSFDGSMYEMFIALLSGAGLVCLEQDRIRDPVELMAAIRDKGATVAALPPAYLKAIGFEGLAGLRVLITAGEKAVRDEKGIFADAHRRYWNLYGPTEASVTAACFPIEPDGGNGADIPIGKPVANMEILILDRFLKNLQPIGVPGEMCLAGPGLARGYLNKPGLTAEKFIPHPFRPGERLYRTGDIGKWLPDGNIQFLGRNDDQVKIRGYRIELGEIKNQLLKQESVKEAVVVAKAFKEDDKKEIAAYVVGDDDLNIDPLRAHLRNTLPDYMIPAYFVRVDAIPLTPNRKVDEKALPHPVEKGMAQGTSYSPPRNERESAIIAAWTDVLGREGIGIDDHYFALGGDSIKAIQLVPRLLQMGWKMEVRDLFRYPTVAELAPHLIPAAQADKAEPVGGTVPLTAVQTWFFQEIDRDRHHFNQAVLLKGKPRFQDEALKAALEAVCRHHDSLRLQFIEKDGSVVQRYAEPGSAPHFEIMDLRGSKSAILQMDAHMNALQSGMNLEKAELVKAAVYRLDEADRLFISVHHLVMDAFSFRILLEDLNAAYSRSVRRQEIQLLPKTASFRTWAEKIHEYAQSDAMDEEKDYWHRIAGTPVSPLPSDFGPGENTRQQAKVVHTELSEEETRFLFTRAHHAYDTQADDLLLAALAHAAGIWTGEKRTIVYRALHGREHIADDVDVSRTVGWFSGMCPILFTLPDPENTGRLIVDTRDELRKIPGSGIGYGLLRYIRKDRELCDTPRHPEIVFINLGQFDREVETEWFSATTEYTGDMFGPKQRRPFALEVDVIVLRGRLRLSVIYDGSRFHEETVRRFFQNYLDALQNIIEHCKRVAA
jgi:amino acid adenylation domain-containing protein/non-ribosomal peptide synthase protein (TIGR01720 family)